MNDYKELVETLRKGTKSPLHVTPDGFMAFDVGVVNALADVIEQYVNDYEILAKMYAKVSEELCTKTKERDAALADLKEGSFCMTCKHLTSTKEEKPCKHCSSLTGGDENHWEWRGVTEDSE